MDTIFTKVEGESFTVNDTVGTSGSALTQARTSANKEPANNIPAGRDTNGDGLWDGFTGQGYLDMGGNAGDRASTSIYVPEAGTYTITFRYSHGGGTAPQTNRDMTLTIDGVTKTVSFPGTGAGAWDNWATAKVQFDLPAGTSTIAIANTIDNGPNIDSVIVSRDIPAPADFQPLVIQAESGVITLKNEADANSTIVRDPSNRESNASLPNGLRPGFTGTGYLDFGDDAGDRVTYTVNVAEAGAYDLSIRYASQPLSNGSPRSLALDVNGASLANTVFPTTGPSSGPAELQGFNVWGFVTQTVALKAGENTITLAIPAGATAGPNLDRLEITRAATGPIPADASADVDSNLALVALDPSLAPAEAAAAAFRLTGVDADVKSFEISFNGGTTRTAVTPVNEGDGSYLITLDLSARPVGNAELTVIVTDNAGNTAQKSAAVTIEDVPVNQAPTGVTLTAVATQVVENVDHSGGLKVAEITVADDGLGSNTLALTGADVAAFEIRDGGLYFVGTADFETKASYQVAVTVGDASLGDGVDATSESFTLAVTDLDETPENRAPVVVGEGLVDAQAAEDSAFSLDLRTKFSDADGDTLTFTATGLPAWLKLENGVLTGTPADSDVAGPVSITVTAKDAAGLEVSDSFNLTVTNTNDAPTLAQAPADQTGKVGQAFNLALPASMFADADLDSGDALTWSVGALPAGVTFDPATRTFSGTPTAAGTHQVTVTATDTANSRARPRRRAPTR